MAGEPQVAETRIKVFISYSRADKAFANDLVLGLAACGFAPYIDRQDIAAGEDWEKRLQGLISEADTVVYVISPDSLSSMNCAFELKEALRLSKRVLPVVWRPVDDAISPAELKRLNYIFFSGEQRTFASGLAQLAEALRTDIDWIREHTRLAALADRWEARSRSPELLLRGDDIDASQTWMHDKPVGGAAVTETQADFIKASADARSAAILQAQMARRGLLIGVSAVAVVMTALAGLSGYFWQDSLGQRDRAKASEASALAANTDLKAANLRLNAKVGLQVAPHDAQLKAPSNWFQVAAQFSGAVARVERLNANNDNEVTSGFVINGAMIHPKFAGQYLLITPAPEPGAAASEGQKDGRQTAIASNGEATSSMKPAVQFLALPQGASRKMTAAEMVWRTPREMAAVESLELWRLEGTPPEGFRAIEAGDVDCGKLGQGGGSDRGERVPFAMFGAEYAQDSSTANATLFLSERLDKSDPYTILYTHSTAPGAAGAAVFDLSTGKVAAIHIGAAQMDSGATRGHGISFRLVLDMIRSKLSDASGHLGPVCGAN